MSDDTIFSQLPIDRATCFTNEKGEQSGKVQKQQGWPVILVFPAIYG